MSRVAAIVPAYNEADRLPRVLQTLAACRAFVEIIVVDDGSEDGTSQAAASLPVRVIRFETNQGKGAAMEAAVASSTADIFFFCDADIHGLTCADVNAILAPVLAGRLDMFVAMRSRPTFARFPWLVNFVPILGGERAVTARLWRQVPPYYKRRFRVEAALNFYARRHGRGFGYRVFPGLTQTIKEKKYGFYRGFLSRLRMSAEVFSAYLRLNWEHLTRPTAR